MGCIYWHKGLPRCYMGSSNYVHIHVDEILRQTDKAYLCLINGEEVWIPKSQIADAADYDDGDKDLTLSITEFIAKQKGLETQEGQ